MLCIKNQLTTFALQDGSGNGGTFNLSNLTSSSFGTNGISTSITSVGNGWYRCVANVNVVSVAFITTFLYPVAGTLNGFNSFYIWGQQIEAGTFPTSYIPTVASQVTRAADNANITGTNFSNFYNSTQGSMYVDYRTIYTTANTSYMFGVSLSGDGANRMSALVNNTPTALRFLVTNRSTNYVQDVQANALNTKYAVSFQNNNLSTAATGTVVGNTFMIMPTVNELGIGVAYTGTGYLNGWIRKLQYYPVALPNAELQEMTA
jgi:hypothetical protein